ncbi:hypothetical protein Cgig2_016439 [Carnegiea gigantea]|uniref:O-GlcNAc transferase C-terminal domain-containing protein n=1 Tax=Carnegiea gigantea TaxID=171969 RepID=A0A9Q1QDV6_9CARY|nr:hypothetical protein Cgig2_016439 [Carnegiea gigantea]
MDLVTQTLNGVDEDYHILANDLRAKLVHYEQRLKFLKSKGGSAWQHQALAVSYASPFSSANSSNLANSSANWNMVVAKIMGVAGDAIGTTIVMVVIINGAAIALPTIPLIQIRRLTGVCLQELLVGARNEIFALQPAPIQVSCMGFPGTMGASCIHYLETDEVRNLERAFFQMWNMYCVSQHPHPFTVTENDLECPCDR